jgi:hypothetical protein
MQRVRDRSPDVRVTGTRTLDDPQQYRAAAVKSLVCRITNQTPSGAARELAGLPWAEFHRRHLGQAGHHVQGLSDSEVIVRALSTSDLPTIAG